MLETWSIDAASRHRCRQDGSFLLQSSPVELQPMCCRAGTSIHRCWNRTRLARLMRFLLQPALCFAGTCYFICYIIFLKFASCDFCSDQTRFSPSMWICWSQLYVLLERVSIFAPLTLFVEFASCDYCSNRARLSPLMWICWNHLYVLLERFNFFATSTLLVEFASSDFCYNRCYCWLELANCFASIVDCRFVTQIFLLDHGRAS